MTIKPILGAVACLGLAGCMDTGTGATGGTQITNEQAFQSAIVGRTITFEGSNSFTVNSDGTVSGPWDGRGITGTWYWEDQYWCREIAIGGTARPDDCQIWVVDGRSATVTRDRGAGSAFTYAIQ